MSREILWRTILASFFVAATVGAQEQALTGEEIIRRSQEAFFSPGEDMKARVVMKLINKAGKERVRELTMLRKDFAAGHQKYFIYFHRPADVREMAFMVWKYPGTDDDRWLFVPAIKLVRRIAADDSRSSFAGSDFTYEDVSGRDLEADVHALLREEALDGKICYLVESVPQQGNRAEYRKKVSWIDRETLLPRKEHYYDHRGEVYRIFTADRVETMGDFPTAVQQTMVDVQKGHRTEVTFAAVEYNVGLAADLFSERYLRQPPARWIQ